LADTAVRVEPVQAPAPTPSSRSWPALGALLIAGSLIVWGLPAPLLDWQPDLAFAQPWRAFSAAFVHWNEAHLAANAGAALVVMALGWVARLPRAATLAWLLAWPCAQWALLLQPALAHYGGASGVLHAGVAVAAVWLVACGSGRQRAIGVLVALGLVAKLLLEAPWRLATHPDALLNIAVAPLAHAGGSLAGAACAIAALAWQARPQNRHG
jgi:rhomboid family GlyGly-CTERM serine protease